MATAPLKMRAGSAADFAVLLAVLAVGTLLVLVFAGTGERPVERSAMGARGLISVLRDAGLPARYAGFEVVQHDARVFRILPILDTDIGQTFIRPKEDAEYLKTGTERDLTRFLVTAKTSSLPTLVIAPKWTRAARHSGYAHPSLLLPPEQTVSGLEPLEIFKGNLVRPPEPHVAVRLDGMTGRLYAPQFFPAKLANGCTPMLSVGPNPLVVRCTRPDAPPLFALSDPDLMNSHGLALAQNAGIAAALVAEMAGDAPILIDTTDEIFVLPERAALPQRSWKDLARFFAYPFSLAWGGLTLLTALLLWRAAIRFGPPRVIFNDRLSASRDVSISAKARLLRMSGNDAALLQRHLQNRLRRIEQQLFGHAAPGAPQARILAHLERTNPALATAFAAALAQVTSGTGAQATGDVAAAMDAFEQQTDRLLDGS